MVRALPHSVDEEAPVKSKKTTAFRIKTGTGKGGRFVSKAYAKRYPNKVIATKITPSRAA